MLPVVRVLRSAVLSATMALYDRIQPPSLRRQSAPAPIRTKTASACCTARVIPTCPPLCRSPCRRHIGRGVSTTGVIPQYDPEPHFAPTRGTRAWRTTQCSCPGWMRSDVEPEDVAAMKDSIPEAELEVHATPGAGQPRASVLVLADRRPVALR